MSNILATGYTPTIQVELPTKAQLLLLRDIQLEYGNKDIAAAVDNVIDMLERRAARITDTSENVKVIHNKRTNGTVRFTPTDATTATRKGRVGMVEAYDNTVLTPAEVKAQADAVCEGYEYHLANGFTEQEREDLHSWWNNKYGDG